MNLKEIRKERGYTVQQVAEGTGLSKTSLNYWESGVRQPAADVLPIIAQFYGITTDELLGYKASTVPAVEVDEEPEYETEDKYGVINLNVNIDTLESAIGEDLNDIKKSFFRIGYKLAIIQRHNLFYRLGYNSLIDYAEDKFGLSKTTTYNFINVYELTRRSRISPEMNAKYLPYNYSQLVELSGNNYCQDDLVKKVKPTDSVKDIHEYVKLWNKTYKETFRTPKGATVKEALEIAAGEKKNPFPAPTLVVSESNACPGQMSMYEEDAEEDSFSPEGESFSSPCVVTDCVSMSEDLPGNEDDESFVSGISPVRHLFKNEKEREEFIRDKNNYTALVLDNRELNLKITRLDFANGAKVYRSEYLECQTWNNNMDITHVSYCLIDKSKGLKPEGTSIYGDYSLKYFNFSGTSIGYIVKYMTLYRSEL